MDDSTLQTVTALAPAANVLNSVLLIDAAERLPALDPWAARAAAALSEPQRRRHRLVCALLEAAPPPVDLEQGFPAYLDALEALAPEALLPAQIGAPDPELRRLLDDPPALHDLAATHLRELWQGGLEGEWTRAQHLLMRQSEQLRERLDAPMAAALHRLVGAEQLAGQAGLRRAVYVPAPHNGRYTTRLRRGDTLYIFFDAPRAFPVLLRAKPVERAEALARLDALNDDVRLRILELFAQQDQISAKDIMERLGLSQSSTSRALKQLGAFVLEGRGHDGAKRYRLAPAQIELTFQALRGVLAGGSPPEQAQPAQEQIARDLRRFVDEQGRILSWPSKERDKLMIFDYLISHFERGRDYTEKEVNAIISVYMHPSFQDVVTMRRELFNRSYLKRERDGSRYWLT
jgi:hypothetical protein